jgi:hypothetical protein
MNSVSTSPSFCRLLLALLPVGLICAGCGYGGMGRSPELTNAIAMASRSMREMPDMDAMEAKSRLMHDLMNSPDLPAWHEQRQKMMLALGDRVFDQTFEKVFDGMIIALASLGCRVNNMERSSGYVTASIPDLGPERSQALEREALAEYIQIKGYSPSVLKRSGPFDFDPTISSGMMSRMGGSGLTLTIAKQSATQTKVKLRFDNIYFPKTSQELYRHVWMAVDKQMFLDRALDAPRTPPN